MPELIKRDLPVEPIQALFLLKSIPLVMGLNRSFFLIVLASVALVILVVGGYLYSR